MIDKIQPAYKKPLYKRVPLRFACTQCGRCCSTRDNSFVFLEAIDKQRMINFFEISEETLEREYVKFHEGDWVLRSKDNQECIFLDEVGGCDIYSVRPVQCQTYPFWPQVVKTAKSWKRESVRCEGINHGDVVPLEKIERCLKSLR